MKKTIMVVDDEESILRLIAMTLSGDEQYRLLLARDGQEAVKLAREERPDLIFLDLRLPKLDGIEVCQELRKDPTTAGTKIVMLTALTTEEDRRRAQEAGADDFFGKPFRPAALLEKVGEMLGPLD